MRQSTNTLYTHLMCSKTGKVYDKNEIQSYSDATKPLVAKYNLEATLNRSILNNRPNNMWRYQELLPIEHPENIVSLEEGMTPLQPVRNLVANNYPVRLFLKNEAFNPTGSFKSRGLSMAISKAKELGINKCVIPTAGNAGGAMSAYCAKAGIEAHVYMPEATPFAFKKECELFGAKLTLVSGNIKDCAVRIANQQRDDWFDVSTLKEPFRLEGKKTMGYEIAEQLQWQSPDVIVYPTGGGTGLIGIWKAFLEMNSMGWIPPKMPRMVAVQTATCDPIVQAFTRNETTAKPYENPGFTIANGLRVPAAFGDEMILEILYNSRGKAISIQEEDMIQGVAQFANHEGILLSPEGAAVWIATKKLMDLRWITPNETIIMLNTGTMYKYMDNLKPDPRSPKTIKTPVNVSS